MFKCILWLYESQWQKSNDRDGYRDRENIYDMAATAILTHFNESEQEKFEWDNNNHSFVFVGFLDNNPAMNTALQNYPKPTITVWNKDTNKTMIVPENMKRDPRKIAAQIKGFIKPSGNGSGGNGNGNGSGFGFGRECSFIDKILDNIGVMPAIKKALYGVGALYLGSRALDSPNLGGQVIQGAGAAYLAFLAMQDNKACSDKKNSIGKIAKSKFVQVYKDRGFKELGWKPITNIRFAQGKAGVYLIKRNGILIYIGAGANVYKTALRHFEPHPADGQNKQNYHDDYDFNDYTIRIVLTGTRERAAKLESALIRKHRPRDNKFIPDEELELTPQQRKVLNQYNEAEAQSPIYLEEEAPF